MLLPRDMERALRQLRTRSTFLVVVPMGVSHGILVRILQIAFRFLIFFNNVVDN